MRQYIGARYTIKVYENSLDPSSAEWESGASYERLVMVTYLNSSYLSKKDVPQNIGNPADNPQYWVVTGYYNGQIASLQDQIDAIDDQISSIDTLLGSDPLETEADTVSGAINELKGDIDDIIDQLPSSTPLSARKFIILTDSYGYEPAFTFPLFTELIPSDLGIPSSRWVTIESNGGGFINPGSLSDTHRGTFLEQLQYVVTSDYDTYTDIIVTAGYNDGFNYTQSQIEGAIEAFCSYVKSTYPNAKIHIGHIGWTTSPDDTPKLRKSCAAYRNAYKYGASYITNAEYICHDYSHFYDAIHPDSTAQERLAAYLEQYILYNKFDVDYRDIYTIETFGTDVSADSTYTPVIYTHLHNDKVTFVVGSQNQTALLNVAKFIVDNVTITAGSYINLFGLIKTLAHPFYLDVSQILSQANISCMAVNANDNIQYCGLSVIGVTGRMSSPVAVNGVKAVYVYPQAYHYDTLWC